MALSSKLFAVVFASDFLEWKWLALVLLLLLVPYCHILMADGLDENE